MAFVLTILAVTKLAMMANADAVYCNHDGYEPIDYCLESHIDKLNNKFTSKSLKCELFDAENDIWFVHEIEYPNSDKCEGDYTIINSKECRIEDNCECGVPDNDCIDPNHQVIFNLVNGEINEETGLCDFETTIDSHVEFIYDGSVGFDCEGNEYMERVDIDGNKCQRLYCNADNLLLVPDTRRRRMFLPIVIVPVITISLTTWAKYCNDNPGRKGC